MTIEFEDLTPREAMKRLHAMISANPEAFKPEFMAQLLQIQSSFKQEQLKMTKSLEDLAHKFTDLYEKYESLNAFIYGYIKSLGAEFVNHREAFYYLYRALELPYDEIKGWNINDETKKKRRPISVFCAAILRKRRRKKEKK